MSSPKTNFFIPEDGSISIWPREKSVVIVFFNKKGQRKFQFELPPSYALTIGSELSKASAFVRTELLKGQEIMVHLKTLDDEMNKRL